MFITDSNTVQLVDVHHAHGGVQRLTRIVTPNKGIKGLSDDVRAFITHLVISQHDADCGVAQHRHVVAHVQHRGIAGVDHQVTLGTRGR